MCCGACSFKRGGHWWFSAARRAPLLQSRSWEQIYLVAFGYLIRSICICFSLACYLIWPYLVDFCRYLIRIWSKYQIYLIFEGYTGETAACFFRKAFCLSSMTYPTHQSNKKGSGKRLFLSQHALLLPGRQRHLILYHLCLLCRARLVGAVAGMLHAQEMWPIRYF